MIAQSHTASHVGSAIGVAVIGAAWVGYLPAVAAGFAILWYAADLITRYGPWLKKVVARVFPAKTNNPPPNA